MSVIGIGSKLAVLTLIYAIFVFALNYYLRDVFTINLVSSFSFLLVILGIVLLTIGILFLIPSIIAVNRAYKADYLCEDGIYSLCRHPLYAAWILFIIPGIVLLFGSWISLSIPLAMYVIFRILIKQEDSYLFNKFGDEYISYKNRVSLLFPMFWRYTKHTNSNKKV